MCVYRWKGVGGHTLALFTGGKAPAGMIYDVFRRKGTGEHKKFFERKNSTMKKLNKKGFTIVELVIVIAVIAILAGVLIPTFATVVTKANQSKAMQEARNEYQAYLAEYAAELDTTKKLVVVTGDYAFEVKDGQFDETVRKAADYSTYTAAGKADLSKVYAKADAGATAGFTYEKGIYTAVETGATYVLATPAADLGSTTVRIYVAE